jgi:hypothetical protein
MRGESENVKYNHIYHRCNTVATQYKGIEYRAQLYVESKCLLTNIGSQHFIRLFRCKHASVVGNMNE